MKHRWMPALVGLLVWGTTMASVAQTPAPAPAAPMAAPLHPQANKAIWDYQKDLGLSDKQVADMKAAAQPLQGKLQALNARFQASSKEFRDLMAKEAPLPQIRAKAAECQNIQLDAQMDQLEVSRKIKGIMTKDQWAKWQAIEQRMRTQRH